MSASVIFQNYRSPAKHGTTPFVLTPCLRCGSYYRSEGKSVIAFDVDRSAGKTKWNEVVSLVRCLRFHEDTMASQFRYKLNVLRSPNPNDNRGKLVQRLGPAFVAARAGLILSLIRRDVFAHSCNRGWTVFLGKRPRDFVVERQLHGQFNLGYFRAVPFFVRSIAKHGIKRPPSPIHVTRKHRHFQVSSQKSFQSPSLNSG